MKSRNPIPAQTCRATRAPARKSTVPSSMTGSDTRARNGSPPRDPSARMASPSTTRGSPNGEDSSASPAIRSLRAQIRYAAMKGIAKPWERFGNAAHSPTMAGTTGA